MTTAWSLEETYETPHGAVRYDVLGEGTPVVLVHGTPWSSYVWRDLAPRLARTHTIYLYDLVGYGESEMQQGQDVSLGVQNDVLAELVEHWGLDAPAVVGHDFGGATVLRTALLNDVGFERIALLDAVSLRPWGSPFYQHVRDHRDAFDGMPPAIHRAIVREYVRGAFSGDPGDETLDPYVEPWLGPDGQPAFYRQLAQNGPEFTDEVEERYGEIDVPVLVIWGENDEWLPLDVGRRLADRIDDASFVTIPNAGHLVQEDAPEAVVRHLSQFLGDDAN